MCISRLHRRCHIAALCRACPHVTGIRSCSCLLLILYATDSSRVQARLPRTCESCSLSCDCLKAPEGTCVCINTVCNEKVCPLLYPHSPPYPNQHRPISRDRPAAGSFTQTGEPDMTTHMSNKRSGTLPLPKTTVRQTTTHDNRAPRPQREEFLAPKSAEQAEQLTDSPTHPPGLPCLPCPAMPCPALPASLPGVSIHSSLIIHPSSIHLQSHPICNICMLPPTRGGPADLLRPGPESPKAEVPCALTPCPIRTLTFKRVF